MIGEIIRNDRFQETFQRIGARYINRLLASIVLNRFGLLEDLSESESKLMENLEIDHRTVQSHCLLSIVYSRQERLPEAQELLGQPMDDKTFHGRENNRLVASHAMAEQRWSDMVAACNAAIGVFKGCGHKLWWARQLIDLGDAYRYRNEPGDQDCARVTYQQTLDMYTEMGAPGYIRVLEERLAEIASINY
jgi:hypothetical protein